jgi:8-oxo-dGTP pyrophosphatase MutT (NUDIX family)
MSTSSPPEKPAFDPQAVELRSAATVILVDDKPELQVFMMKRNANTAFAGGMWVFPGGSVDVGDSAANYSKYCVHRSEAESCATLGLEKGGLAYYVAAIREAFEEAGILLGLHQAGQAPLALLEADVIARFDAHRDGVNDGSLDFLEVLNRESLLLDAATMHYVARWITPVGPPRRFDTRFFLARMPADQQPMHDDHELTHSSWLAPKEILRRAQNKEFSLMPPTMRMVECLAQFGSATEVIEAAAANLPDIRVPMNGVASDVASGAVAGAQAAEPGWVRLRPLKTAES